MFEPPSRQAQAVDLVVSLSLTDQAAPWAGSLAVATQKEDGRPVDAAKGAVPGAKVVLMGAGFIGCIIMEALAMRGVELSVVEMGDRMVPRMMGPTAGNMIKRWCEGKGVRILTGMRAVKIACDNSLCGPHRLMRLRNVAMAAARRELGGAFVECGVFRGGSGAVMRSNERSCYSAASDRHLA